MVGARITSIGTYVPPKKLTNFDLERKVETNNEWIIQRTGIHERRIAGTDEFTSDLCVLAVKDMMQRYNKTVEDVDMIIVATSTRDFPFLSVSSIIKNRLNISNTGAIDVNAACAGFVMLYIQQTTILHLASTKKYLLLEQIPYQKLLIIRIEVHVCYLAMELARYWLKGMNN